jgi:outer membrane protein assembly factor BamB
LVLGVGGHEALLMALDAATGELIWQTDNTQQ